MITDLHRYSISKRRRLIDSAPMRQGEGPLVWSPEKHEWVDLDTTFGEYADSLPITDEEAQRFLEAGDLPENISQSLRIGITDDKEVL